MASNENANTSAPHPELEVDKLHSLPSEQQDLYVLTFTSDLARHVAGLDADGATAQQMYVKKEVFKVLNLSSPTPTRVIRNNLGTCLAGIFEKGDRKLLFESVNELLNILTSSKSDKDGKARHAAIHCLGNVFEIAGDSAISLSTVTITNIRGQFKTFQNNSGLRAAIFKALGRLFKGIGKSADEAIARDVWKQARQAVISEKSLLLQSNAFWCIEQMFQYTPYFDNSNDYERLQSIIFKAFDSNSPSVRCSAASCLSSIYVKNYSEAQTQDGVPIKQKPKKRTPNPVNAEEVTDAHARSSSPAPKAATSIAFSISDMIRQLFTHYCKPGTTHKARAGIIVCCIKIFRSLPDGVIEEHYNTIALLMFNDLLNAPAITHNRYRLLITRRFINIILGDLIGRKILGEAGQLNAIKFLVNGILKDYPQSDVKERPEPKKETIIGALDTLSILIQCLGSATNIQSEACRGAILQVLEHPSYTVQVHAARCLKALVLACPQQLLPSVTICMNSVKREVDQLTTPRRSPRRCLGLAFGLAAAVSTSNLQPLYGSVDVYSRILSQATSILKSSSGSDLRISSTQIQVAWILIGGLMALGPSFVKIHISQLLLLWKNALPKPLGKDNIGQQGLLELSFLTHVRECALSSIRAFLTYNGRLLTVDVAKRLAVMLQNTITFVSSLPSRKTTDDADRRLSPSLQLQDYELLVRRRAFECYIDLLNAAPGESYDTLLQSNMLSLAVSSFADVGSIAISSLNSSIASSSGTFESIWDVGDNLGFGVNGLIQDLNFVSIVPQQTNRWNYHWLAQNNHEAIVNRIIRSPPCQAAEHDSLLLYATVGSDTTVPLGTGTVDAAIRLFATSLPLQSPKVQEGALDQLTQLLSANTEQQNAVRESAVILNIVSALFYALDIACQDVQSSMSTLKAQSTEKALQEMLHGFIVHNELAVRNLAAEALGRLCKSSGSDFTSREVSQLVEIVVSNRDPDTRSGCAMALGCIVSELGGMAASLHMKNILGILTSLASDPHPTVHFWALDGVSKIAESVGLAFSGYVSSTLGTLAQLYVAESHGEETVSVTSSNMEIDMPTLTVIARCIDSTINVLGPDLQDMTKTRNMILTLTYQFQTEASPLVTVESLKCLENLSMYAPGHISFQPYIRQLQNRISSSDPDVRETAVTGLYNSMRRGAEEVLKTADPTLEDQLWVLLDDSYGDGIIRELIRDWVRQSGPDQIELWVHRIQKVLTKVRAHSGIMTIAKPVNDIVDPDIVDEEVAGFAAAAAQTAKDDPGVPADATQELLRWQVRHAAMECMNDILSIVAEETALHGMSSAIEQMQPRIAEIVKIAFSASTASVVELRIQGIQIIHRVLQIFGKIPDPDFPDATLLEQYQAQISSALTPAFASDSSPLLAAKAIGVCAAFISTGIVTNVDRMGRILKLLVSALEDFQKEETESTSIGDLKGLSSNAQTMVKLSVFSAWAELQIASHEQQYLEKVLKPHLPRLTPLWLGSLREYARLKFEPDISMSGAGPISSDLDTIYAALNREILLTFYQATWLNFVNAIASLIEENSEAVFEALDDKSNIKRENGDLNMGLDINYRDEPVAFFFVLFGISFEALAGRSSNDSAVTHRRTLAILEAMKRILQPSVAGLAIYQDAIFSESMDLLDRLALIEGLEVQTVIVDIARNLCTSHPSARKSDTREENDEHLSDDIDQLFELTRIIVLVISQHVPNLSQADTPTNTDISDTTVTLIRLSLIAIVNAAEVFPAIIKSDLHACIFHIFATILSTSSCQAKLVPQALPIFRRFVISLARNPQHETVTQIRSALARFSMILHHAQQRESPSALPCEKNTLMAGMLLLTSTARILPPNDPLITRFTTQLSDSLSHAATTHVATGLTRSLLLTGTSNSASAAEMQISATLVPRLLAFLLASSPVAETRETRPIVAHTLATFVSCLPQTQKASALALVLPALLARAVREGEAVWPETGTRLLDLAQSEQGPFRAVVAGFAQEQRALLKRIVEFGEEAEEEEESVQEGAPSIELRMDFGG